MVMDGDLWGEGGGKKGKQSRNASCVNGRVQARACHRRGDARATLIMKETATKSQFDVKNNLFTSESIMSIHAPDTQIL